MLGYLVTGAVILWVISRGRLWKYFFNVRREIRAALRRRSFPQYFVAVRFREILGLIAFVLAAVGLALADETSYAQLHPWARVLFFIALAAVTLYLLYLVVDARRLRHRFNRLLNARRRGRPVARY
jgi:hypothetical protein